MSDFEERLRRRLRDYAAYQAPSIDPAEIAAAVTNQPQRPSWPRLLAAAAVVLLAVVGTTAGLSALGNQSRSGSPSPAAVGSPSTAASASEHPTSSTSPAATPKVVVPRTLDLSAIAFRHVVPPSLATPNAPVRLDVGTLDGAVPRPIWFTAGSPLTLAAFGALNPVVAAGPVQGQVIYVKNTDPAEIHVIDARTGSDELLLTDDAVIWSVAIAPDARRAYLLRAGRSDAEFLGVDSISLANPSDRHTLIAASQLASARGLVQLAVAAPFWAQLLADDQHVVAVVCRDQHCLMPVVDLSTGVVTINGNLEFGESLIGLLPDAAIGDGGFRLNLTDGRRTPLAGEAQFHPVVMVDSPAGPMALADLEEESGTYRVEALDLRTGERSIVASRSFIVGRTHLRLVTPQANVAAELPAGWTLLSENADSAPAPPPQISAVSIDGQVVPLPVIGP
jgi:hypothetical protein